MFVVISLLACLRLNPAGLVKLSRGLPSVIALTVTIGVTFEVVTAYLPHASYGAGYSVAVGGGFLTITGICWAIGSWIQGIDAIQLHTTPAQRVGTAFILLAFGIAGLATLAIGASIFVGSSRFVVNDPAVEGVHATVLAALVSRIRIR